MPTYKRPEQLPLTLAALAAQTRRLDHLVIVDNGGDAMATLRHELTSPRAAAHVTLLEQSENLGPAGALAVGLDFVLAHAPRDCLVTTIDDDDPPLFADTIESLSATAAGLAREDPRFGAVGFGGSLFNPRLIRLRRLRNEELTGAPMHVDMLSGNHMPLMDLAAVRAVGTYQADLFFGFDDLEFFLRMKAGGWHVYCDTALLLRYRQARGRSGAKSKASWRLGKADWRRFYSIRNEIHIARRYAGPLPTLWLSARLVGKVAVNYAVDRRAAASHRRLTLRACRDGWSGRLGRPWLPDLTADGRLSSDNGRSVRRPARLGNAT